VWPEGQAGWCGWLLASARGWFGQCPRAWRERCDGRSGDRSRRLLSSCWAITASRWSWSATRRQNRLRWLLHDRWPEFDIPAQAVQRDRSLDRVARRLGRTDQAVDVRIAPELVRQIRSLPRGIKESEVELAALVAARAPALLELPGCEPMTAATIFAGTAGPGPLPDRCRARSARRRRADPRLLGQASTPPPRPQRQPQASTAPCTASRSPKAAATHQPPATSPRRQVEGKTRKEALGALKPQRRANGSGRGIEGSTPSMG
jgi:hypothetical protein